MWDVHHGEERKMKKRTACVIKLTKQRCLAAPLCERSLLRSQGLIQGLIWFLFLSVSLMAPINIKRKELRPWMWNREKETDKYLITSSFSFLLLCGRSPITIQMDATPWSSSSSYWGRSTEKKKRERSEPSSLSFYIILGHTLNITGPELI